MEHHTKSKGNIALTKCIADLTTKGYDIFLPISEHLPFDLIAYKDGKQIRIQVKYITDDVLRKKTIWADKKQIHSKKYAITDFDFYCMYVPNIDKCLYPHISFGGISIRHTTPNSSCYYWWYEDFFDFTTEAKRHFTKGDVESYKANLSGPKKRKVPRPSKDELEKLVWEIPTTTIAQTLGVSDIAVAKWCKNYGIEKPPRGYWSKKTARNKQ